MEINEYFYFMDKFEKKKIIIDSLFWDGVEEYYRVKWFCYTEGITYKYDGKPIEDNVVHVDIINPKNLNDILSEKAFLHIKFLEGIPITKPFLEQIGFTNIEENGNHYFCLGNAYFVNLDNNDGYYMVWNKSANRPESVQFIHEVQLISLLDR